MKNICSLCSELRWFDFKSALPSLFPFHNSHLPFCNDSSHELVFHVAEHTFCNKTLPNEFSKKILRYLKTGEYNFCIIGHILLRHCGPSVLQSFLKTNESKRLSTQLAIVLKTLLRNSSSVTSWECVLGNQVYMWTVDFHASPSVCNIPIYKNISVVLHPEIDHRPHCEYSGFCKDRLQIFGLGGYMVSFKELKV